MTKHALCKLSPLSILFLFSAALLIPASASATPSIAVSDNIKKERRTEVNVGMLAGGTDIGENKRYTVGVQAQVGRRFGDLVMLGEFDYLGLGRSDSQNQGTMSRLGLTARYSLLRTGASLTQPRRRSPVSGDYWLELGAGMERVAWDRGGVVHRPDVVMGFGWQMNVVINHKSTNPKYYGPYVAFRASLARAPESTMEMPSVCAGPCDTATPPPGNDVSLFFHMGMNWGS